MKRVATLRFEPAPRVNIPTGISYTDIDAETGERIRVPVGVGSEQGAEHAVFVALLRMALIQLAFRLGVDWSNRPSWVPPVDVALDAGVMLTSSRLHRLLLDDLLDDEDLTEEEAPSGLTSSLAAEAGPANVHFHSLPELLMRIGIVLEAVERRDDGITRAFIDPSEGSRERFVEQIVSRAVEPFEALQRVFGIEDAEPAELKLGVGKLAPEEQAQKLGEIEDLAIATCIAWTANLETSTEFTSNQRLGFWLCDAEDKPISQKVALDVTTDDGARSFNLDLSTKISGSELSKMNEALEKLVQYSTTG